MKRLLTLALVIGATGLQSARADVTGRSFYQPLSITSQHELLTVGNHWYAHNAKPKRNDLQLSVNGFYQASSGGSHMSNYFMPEGKRQLEIRGANAGVGDVSGTWLQIVGSNANDSLGGGADEEQLLMNDYSSTLSMSPSFQLFGATPLATYWNKVKGMPWFVSVGLPVGKMVTNMHLKEENITGNIETFNGVGRFIQSTGGGLNASWPITQQYSLSAIESLGNSGKRYGKINSHNLTATGMGDLFFDLGLQVRDNMQVGVRVDMPTSVKASGEYLFQPVLGNNGRGALRAYAQGFYQALSRERFSLTLNARAEASAILAGHQMRTYDLQGYGAWSRYLLMLDGTRAELNETSGVNLLTRPTRVGQMHQGDLNLGARLHAKKWSVAANYNFTIRGAERLNLYTQMPERAFVVGMLSGNNVGEGNLIYVQQTPNNISGHARIYGASAGEIPSDSVNANAFAITNNNIDIASAAQPQYLANQFSLSGDYQCTLGGYATDLKLGANYAFVRGGSHSNVYSLFGAISIKV